MSGFNSRPDGSAAMATCRFFDTPENRNPESARDAGRKARPCGRCSDIRRHDTYYNIFGRSSALGLRPGARRAMGRPRHRSRSATNSSQWRAAVRAFALPERGELLLVARIGPDQLRKIAHTVEYRANENERVVFRAKVGAHARPCPILRFRNKPGTHGIEAYITHRRDQMGLVHGYGPKPALKQMPGPAPARIDEVGITPGVPRRWRVQTSSRRGTTIRCT